MKPPRGAVATRTDSIGVSQRHHGSRIKPMSLSRTTVLFTTSIETFLRRAVMAVDPVARRSLRPPSSSSGPPRSGRDAIYHATGKRCAIWRLLG